MSECQEIARTLHEKYPNLFNSTTTLDEIRGVVRQHMQDETVTVIDNVAYAWQKLVHKEDK